MKPLVYENWPKGIELSPHLGIADMRNLDIYTEPGALRLNFALQRTTPATVTKTFTVVAATDIATIPSGTFQFNGHGATKRSVLLTTTGSLPAGLSTGTIYYLIDVSGTTFKFATTLANADAGTAIDITTTGTGVHTVTSVDPKQVLAFSKDIRNTIEYAIDTDGRVWAAAGVDADWFLITGNTIASGSHGNGIQVWKNYVAVFRSDKIDMYGPLNTGTASWTNDFQSLTQSAGDPMPHATLVGQDDILYWGDLSSSTGASMIGSLSEISGQVFDPTNAATYLVELPALDLPNYKFVTKIRELGVNLEICTTGVEIYPWNRTDESFQLPIISGESNITAADTLNNILYFGAGNLGTIYGTVGTSTKELWRVPYYISSAPFNQLRIGDMKAHKGRIFFTIEGLGCSGLWSYNPITGATVLEYQYSNGSYGVTNPVQSRAIKSEDSERIYIAWYDQDQGIQGIDIPLFQEQFYYTTGYLGYVETEFQQVGSAAFKQTTSSLELEMARAMLLGQGVRVKYRKFLSDSFTLIETYDFATYAGFKSLQKNASISDAEFVQLRIEITTGVSSNTTPELRNVILR